MFLLILVMRWLSLSLWVGHSYRGRHAVKIEIHWDLFILVFLPRLDSFFFSILFCLLFSPPAKLCVQQKKKNLSGNTEIVEAGFKWLSKKTVKIVGNSFLFLTSFFPFRISLRISQEIVSRIIIEQQKTQF